MDAIGVAEAGSLPCSGTRRSLTSTSWQVNQVKVRYSGGWVWPLSTRMMTSARGLCAQAGASTTAGNASQHLDREDCDRDTGVVLRRAVLVEIVFSAPSPTQFCWA